MGRHRERWLRVVTVVGSFALFLGLAEAALQFLPVATGMRSQPVTEESPTFHFQPNRDFVFSKRWDMIMVNRGHVNNAGFINDRDYSKEETPPLLAVVGDSFIEAAMVPFAKTMHGRLAQALEGRLRVYSFGGSGAPLSQYVIWARHAAHEYGAQALVINIIGNDFDESFAAYKLAKGHASYMRDVRGDLHLQLIDYNPSPVWPVLLRSALVRYLVFNLNVPQFLENLKARVFYWSAPPRFAGNTLADANPRRLRDSIAVIDAFFRDLPDLTGLPPDRVMFTMDGFRYPELMAAGGGTYFDVMRRAFHAKAEALGYEVIDLDSNFFARHARTGERFEFPHDGHWNAAGHEVAFEAVMASRLIKALVR